MDKVWVAAVSHTNGTNIYLAKTEAGLSRQVAAFCREYWQSDDSAPEDDGETISLYFRENDDDFLEGWHEETVGD